MSDRAMRACRDYEHWASEVARLTAAIATCACPSAIPEMGEGDWLAGPEPTCFERNASRTVDDCGEGERRIWLDEIAPLVADCPACSRLVTLIRDRRHARRQLGVAKRRIRSVGKLALAAPGAAALQGEGKVGEVQHGGRPMTMREIMEAEG